MKIINVREHELGMDQAIKYIHSKWGNESNFLFYEDAIRNSKPDGEGLPEFFLLIKEEKIAGCVGLITNDYISRHDLYPWIGLLFVEKDERGNEYGSLLMEHAANQAKKSGFDRVYLTTEHDGYYEKYGWRRIEDGIDLFTGKPTRIYTKGV